MNPWEIFFVVLLVAGGNIAWGRRASGRDEVFVPTADCPEFPVQNTSSIPAIIETCYYFLQCHLVEGTKWGLPFHFYRPSLEKYSPDQWLWDSGCHEIVWSHRNVTNSILDLRTLLSMQLPDGRVPEEIFWSNQSYYDEILDQLVWSSDQIVDLTQVPLLPFSLRAIYNQSKSLAVLQEFIPPLVRWFDWWSNVRDPDKDGLVTIIHGWEGGLDASPLYDPAYGITTPHPAFLELYPRFLELVERYKWEFGWNQTLILDQTVPPPFNDYFEGWFEVEDVGLNSIYAAGWGILSDLSQIMGNTTLATYCRTQEKKVTDAILSQMWDTRVNRFVSWYKDPVTGVRKNTTIETTQSLFPLLLRDLPQAQVDTIIQTQVLNTSKFWLEYPVPSVSADAAQFEPVFTVDLMARGPTWPILNWLVMEGLVRHNRTDIAEELLSRWVKLYELSGVWEQYNPLTGASYGAVGLGMSTLIVDWLYRLGWAQP